jgi:hypothetical protein
MWEGTFALTRWAWVDDTGTESIREGLHYAVRLRGAAFFLTLQAPIW